MQDDRVVVEITKSGGTVRPVGRPTLEAICAAVPDLNMNGFRGYRTGQFCTTDAQHEEYRNELLNHASWASSVIGLPSHARIERLQGWLSGFERANTWTRSTSYGLKHIFEREAGIYVPEGLFIVGALMAGFTAKFWDDSTSAVFQMRRPVAR
jgi:hypothetical protein